MSSQSTESRGAWLWHKQAAIFGARFLDMWADIDAQDVQAEWTHALQGLSREALLHGVAACYHMRHVPTLPEFLDACRIEPMYRPFTGLTDQRQATPEVVEPQLANMRAVLAGAGLPKRGVSGAQTGIEWAVRIEQQADSDTQVPLLKLALAREAIDLWCASQHCTREDLDEHGGWRGGSRAAAARERVGVGVMALPPRVPSPHIVGDDAPVREPGCDDEEVSQ
ncbi:hypothetical protein [Paraburkholderia sp. HD33-4]|uniref:hypothetical protein n=1 Tax=Paraburkholderia sp. HD33-4 TaxID=2883242 RepID=UPI001F22A35A|nr:hypothetical protein [Paraburkholderia sp. HD33-4]